MMDSANLSTQPALNDLYGSWNPMSYIQGQQNQDLADQFRQQAYQANNNNVEEGALKNIQSSQMNPGIVQQQALTNTGLGLKNDATSIQNQSAGIDLGQKQALAPDNLDAQRQELYNRLGDANYHAMENSVMQLHMEHIASGDPDKIAQTSNMVQFLGGPIGSKAADRAQTAQLEREKLANQSGIAQTQAASAGNVANINSQSRQAVANTHAEATQNAAMLKQSLNQKVAYLGGLEQTPEVAEQLKQARADLATASTAYQGMIDLQALQNGGSLQRNADRPNSAAKGISGGATPKLSDEDLINKYKK